jgi:cysteine desulfurase NifS
MGTICQLGERAPQIVYSPNRLLHPMRRVGEKGTFDFQRISWDEAYGLLVENLTEIKRESGAEATAIYTGVGSFEQSLCDVYQPKGVAVSSASSVLFPFGSPNTMGVGALCYVAYGMIAPHVTLGRMFINMFSDIENSELIVVWGTNPATDLPPVDFQRTVRARARGAQVVVIDPRRTATVKLANAEWIPIRPGTDGALALGLCQVLIKEELYDEEFTANWTIGFDDFVRYAQHYRPDVVEHITGVPAATVRSLARRIAEARGVSQLMYTGMEYSNSGVQAIRATLVLWALAGQLDVPGGLCMTMRENHFPINREGHVANPDVGPRLGSDRFPVYVKYRDEAHAIALPDSVLRSDPYRIRALIILGSSMTTSWPQSPVWRETLKQLDFLVSIDRQLTADCAYADLVLPATTYFENVSYMTYGSVFRIRERMIEPLGEARSDARILAELAERLGYGHLYPQTEEELLRHVLRGSGFSLEDVRKAGGTVAKDSVMMQYRKWEKGLLRDDGRPGFDTPSGKLEISSTVLEEFGYDPLPVYTEPREGPLSQPELAKDYPLVFNSGSRARTSFHTQHHHVAGLNRKHQEPTVMIHTADAAARGIDHGDWVALKTRRGRVRLRALVTEEIVHGAVDARHSGGGPLGPEPWRDCNINELTDLDNFDAISGFPVYKCLLCEVEKLSDGADGALVAAEEIGAPEIVAAENQPAVKQVYLDHNATTPMAPVVRQAMVEVLDLFGNPSSLHRPGIMARRLVDEARRKVARLLGCTARRIVFTGGGSEANNLAIKGAALAAPPTRNEVITSTIEHPAVLEACRWLASRGFAVTFLQVDGTGRVNPDCLARAISDRTCLVSIMLANNETGSIQPIRQLAEMARQHGALFHSDAVQGVGKIPVDPEELGVDLLTLSAHKVHGPKGVGALYVRKGVLLQPLVHGGGQEAGLRSGTENVLAIAGFGSAADYAGTMLARSDETRRLRDRLEQEIVDRVPDAWLNGHRERRLPNTLNMTLPGFRGESLVLEMNKRGVYFSSGSACHSGSSGPSHALLAMGLSEESVHGAVRLSLGPGNTDEEIEYVAESLGEVIAQSKQIVRFVSCK